MNKEPMTEQGYEKITKELEQLKTVTRGEVAKEIQEARELGDLKENAEYHAAKDKQGLMEGRISFLENLVALAQIINPAELPHEKVSFGSTVTLLDLDSDEEKTYTIVGSVEANADKGYISFNSPLAKQLLGKEEGDDFTAKLPSGEVDFEITEVKYVEITLD